MIHKQVFQRMSKGKKRWTKYRDPYQKHHNRIIRFNWSSVNRMFYLTFYHIARYIRFNFCEGRMRSQLTGFICHNRPETDFAFSGTSEVQLLVGTALRHSGAADATPFSNLTRTHFWGAFWVASGDWGCIVLSFFFKKNAQNASSEWRPYCTPYVFRASYSDQYSLDKYEWYKFAFDFKQNSTSYESISSSPHIYNQESSDSRLNQSHVHRSSFFYAQAREQTHQSAVLWSFNQWVLWAVCASFKRWHCALRNMFASMTGSCSSVAPRVQVSLPNMQIRVFSLSANQCAAGARLQFENYFCFESDRSQGVYMRSSTTVRHDACHDVASFDPWIWIILRCQGTVFVVSLWSAASRWLIAIVVSRLMTSVCHVMSCHVMWRAPDRTAVYHWKF